MRPDFSYCEGKIALSFRVTWRLRFDERLTATISELFVERFAPIVSESSCEVVSEVLYFSDSSSKQRLVLSVGLRWLQGRRGGGDAQTFRESATRLSSCGVSAACSDALNSGWHGNRNVADRHKQSRLLRAGDARSLPARPLATELRRVRLNSIRERVQRAWEAIRRRRTRRQGGQWRGAQVGSPLRWVPVRRMSTRSLSTRSLSGQRLLAVFRSIPAAPARTLALRMAAANRCQVFQSHVTGWRVSLAAATQFANWVLRFQCARFLTQCDSCARLAESNARCVPALRLRPTLPPRHSVPCAGWRPSSNERVRRTQVMYQTPLRNMKAMVKGTP